MPTLLLIRHGDNEYLAKNRLPGHTPGIHLNKHGREQADELSKSLSHLPIKAIYASPLERAIETAEPLANSTGQEIKIQPGLIDADVGEWEGRFWKVLRRTKFWKVIQQAPSKFQFPGGESFVQVQERVIATLNDLILAHHDELIAVFFHADPIKLAVAHYIGLELDNFQRLTSSPGSVTILNADKSNMKLLALNLIPPISLPKI
jgi:probable phosphomutase (TIGR03848 family)